MMFVCDKCGKKHQEHEVDWCCSCGGHLSCDYEVKFSRNDIKTDRFNMWRYDAAYPIKYEELKVSYQEGLTPLVKVSTDRCNLRLKMDNLMPTGSFKDRGIVMVINYLLKNGVKKITEDSSGNAGASVAGYCALGNIPCDIFVPSGNSVGKLIQIQAYGATIHEVTGSRESVAAAAQKHPESYAGHNWHPMFLEGTKSIAYELWEQNGFKAPENIISSAGNGSTILGIYYGFKDLLKNGQIEKMPRLFPVQAENCNPIYREFVHSNSDKPFEHTIAEGISLAKPNKGKKVVNAAKDTGGAVLSMSEESIVNATKELAGKGFYVEPTSAVAYAGLCKLLDDGVLNENSEAIVTISGNGLKASVEIAELFNNA